MVGLTREGPGSQCKWLRGMGTTCLGGSTNDAAYEHSPPHYRHHHLAVG